MTRREHVIDALRFWETARIPYNAVLAVTTIASWYFDWRQCPTCRVNEMVPSDFVKLAIYALIANVVYCAAYVPDLLVHNSDFRARRKLWRRGLWFAGAAFAAVLAWVRGWQLFYPY